MPNEIRPCIWNAQMWDNAENECVWKTMKVLNTFITRGCPAPTFLVISVVTLQRITTILALPSHRYLKNNHKAVSMERRGPVIMFWISNASIECKQIVISMNQIIISCSSASMPWPNKFVEFLAQLAASFRYRLLLKWKLHLYNLHHVTNLIINGKTRYRFK